MKILIICLFSYSFAQADTVLNDVVKWTSIVYSSGGYGVELEGQKNKIKMEFAARMAQKNLELQKQLGQKKKDDFAVSIDQIDKDINFAQTMIALLQPHRAFYANLLSLSEKEWKKQNVNKIQIVYAAQAASQEKAVLDRIMDKKVAARELNNELINLVKQADSAKMSDILMNSAQSYACFESLNNKMELYLANLQTNRMAQKAAFDKL